MAPTDRKRARSPSEVPDALFESRLFPVGPHILLVFISLFQLGCLLYFSPVLSAGCCPVMNLCPLVRRSRFSAVVTAAKVRGPGHRSGSRAKRPCEWSLKMSLSVLVMIVRMLVASVRVLVFPGRSPGRSWLSGFVFDARSGSIKSVSIRYAIRLCLSVIDAI